MGVSKQYLEAPGEPEDVPNSPSVRWALQERPDVPNSPSVRWALQERPDVPNSPSVRWALGTQPLSRAHVLR
jgi:hypothetical protein